MANDLDQIDSSVGVVTPENIAIRYQVAGPFRRLPAYVIDVCVRLLVLALIGIVLLFTPIGLLRLGIFLVIWFAIEWFYGGLFETYWNGQTPGKRAMGIRVLSIDGQPINGMQAILRNILRYVDLMPLLSAESLGVPAAAYVIPSFFVGLVVAATNNRFQRLGDMVCETMVVIDERSWQKEVVKLDDPRAAQLAGYVPANFQASPSLARALAAYVERRKLFSWIRRCEIARHLGEPLLARFGLAADTSYDLLMCALYHRTFIAKGADDEGGVSSAEPAGHAPATTAAVDMTPLPQEEMVNLITPPTDSSG